MKRLFESLVFAAAVSLTCACGSGASPDPQPARSECEELRAHVVELRLSAAADKHDSTEMNKHRTNLVASLGDEFVDTCTAEQTPAYVECALDASSREELNRCLSR